MMIYSCIFLVSLIMIGLISWRVYSEYVMKKVGEAPTMDPLMKRKWVYFKYKMRSEHPLILFGISALAAVSLFLLTLVQLTQAGDVRTLKEEKNQLTEEVAIVKNEQEKWLKMTLFPYPKNGGLFESIDWEHLLVSNDLTQRFELEHELAHQLSPFFGRTLVFLFVDQPMQELSLTLMCRLDTVSDLAHWEENWAHLMAEIAGETLLTQGTVVVQFSKDPQESFEQTMLRDEEGNWQYLDKRLLLDEETEKTDAPKAFETSPSVESEETKEPEKPEQKGGVIIDE